MAEQDKRIEALEAHVDTLTARLLTLDLIVRVLAARSDDFTFIEVLEWLEVPPAGDDPVITHKLFKDRLALADDLRRQRREHIDFLIRNHLGPESRPRNDR